MDQIILPPAPGLADIDLDDPLTNHPLNEGRVAWWLTLPVRFGGPAWWDLVRGSQGTLTGFAAGHGWNTASNPGATGSISFSGSEYVSTTKSSPAGTNNITVACWVNPAVLTRGDLVTAWNNGATVGDQFDLLYGLSSGKPQFYISSGLANISSGASSVAMSTGTWYRVVGIFRNGTLGVYLNGINTAFSTPAITLGSGAKIRLGNNINGDGPFSGYLNDCAVWNRGLSDVEIALDYKLSRQGYPGVLRRRQRVAYSTPPSPPASSLARIYLPPARGLVDIDLDQPLTDHPLNVGRVFWQLALPNRFGGPVAWDLVQGLRGTLTGFTGNGWTPGGINFNGTTTFVDLGTPTSLELYSNFTVICRIIHPAAASGSQFACAKDFSTGNRGWGIGVDSGGQLYVEASGTPTFQGVGPSLVDGLPHVIALSVPRPIVSTTWSVYVDGKSVNSNPVVAPSANTLAHTYIGGRSYVGFFNGFVGSIQSVELYNRSLSANEITLGYQLSRQGYPGVLRRRRRVAYSAGAAPAGGLRPYAAYINRQRLIGTGVY